MLATFNFDRLMVESPEASDGSKAARQLRQNARAESEKEARAPAMDKVLVAETPN
jgi:hypothetical protein